MPKRCTKKNLQWMERQFHQGRKKIPESCHVTSSEPPNPLPYKSEPYEPPLYSVHAVIGELDPAEQRCEILEDWDHQPPAKKRYNEIVKCLRKEGEGYCVAYKYTPTTDPHTNLRYIANIQLARFQIHNGKILEDTEEWYD